MNSKSFRIIAYSFLLVVGTYFLFLGLFQAKGFLIPLSMGIFLSLVMLPLANWLEGKGMSRGLAVLLSDLLILFFCAVIVFMISLQVYQIGSDWPEYEKKLTPKYEQVLEFVSDKTGTDVSELKTKMQDSLKKAGESKVNESGIVSKMFSFLGNFLLVFIYIFFLMFYKQKIKNSILGFVAEEKRDKARKIITQASKVAQQYLFGRFILILVLAILYTAGLLILGLKQAVLIAFIAALLSLIPYVGNLVGFGIAILMGVLTADGSGIIIGISVVFVIAQFVESYILEPFVVGEKVDLNPTLTIIGVVMFGMVWGLAGMFLAIPFMGILKAISDNVPELKPVGYTLGNEDISSDSGWLNKIKTWFVKKKKNSGK